eukprot:1886394-Prymnesium_polylepis.1
MYFFFSWRRGPQIRPKVDACFWRISDFAKDVAKSGTRFANGPRGWSAVQQRKLCARAARVHPVVSHTDGGWRDKLASRALTRDTHSGSMAVIHASDSRASLPVAAAVRAASSSACLLYTSPSPRDAHES